MLAALVDLSRPGHYLHWGFIQISVANGIVILAMFVVFALALLIPFPRLEAAAMTTQVPPAPSAAEAPSWTGGLRRAAERALPPEKLLPDKQPSYVASWVYVFGVLTLAAFVVILLSGVVLVWRGPSWWHVSKVGLFFNSIHLWSVELFFFFMVLHLWGKFFMAAWRGRRRMTWITGVVSFVVSIGTAFTGYLSQQNFDSQWISTQAKDGLNSVGVGAFFNVMNFGQMLIWHVLLLPVCVAALVGLHLLLVRHRGVVRPIKVRGPLPVSAGADGPKEA